MFPSGTCRRHVPGVPRLRGAVPQPRALAGWQCWAELAPAPAPYLVQPGAGSGRAPHARPLPSAGSAGPAPPRSAQPPSLPLRTFTRPRSSPGRTHTGSLFSSWPQVLKLPETNCKPQSGLWTTLLLFQKALPFAVTRAVAILGSLLQARGGPSVGSIAFAF